MDNSESSISTHNKVPFDPGWNDPPTFTYSAQSTTPNRPRNFLNKRVAFPLSNTGVTPPSNVNIPPMPITTTLPVAPIVQSTSLNNSNSAVESQGNVQIDCEKALLEVKEALLGILDNSSELGAKADNIRKKITTMEEMWSSGKLNAQVHLKMQELAKALKENPQKADEIHKALMVDHVSLVGNWMPGVKQLIYNCIARSELLAIEKESI